MRRQEVADFLETRGNTIRRPTDYRCTSVEISRTLQGKMQYRGAWGVSVASDSTIGNQG